MAQKLHILSADIAKISSPACAMLLLFLPVQFPLLLGFCSLHLALWVGISTLCWLVSSGAFNALQTQCSCCCGLGTQSW